MNFHETTAAVINNNNNNNINNDYDDHINYLNRKLLELQGFKCSNIAKLKQPLKIDEKKYLFELNMWVFSFKSNSKYLKYSGFSDSPQNILNRYLKYGRKDSTATIAYDNVCRLLGVSDATYYLADMITPNTDRSKWFFNWDIEWTGFQIAPLFLTISDMQRIINASPCRSHIKYMSSSTTTNILDDFINITTDNNNNNNNNAGGSDLFYLTYPISFLNFLPVMDSTCLDPNKIYVPKSLKFCYCYC